MLNKLRQLESQGLITLRPNHDSSLWIANYTPEVQYDRLWGKDLLLPQCRGLVVDNDGNIIARPFKKFFNLEEHNPSEIPEESFKVYEKLDGSLGILFYFKDKWQIASRGSFKSEQAKKANQILNQEYSKSLDSLDINETYLLEIIYPENRIVVDYGNEEKLVMLGAFHTLLGEEVNFEYIRWPHKAKNYNGITDISTIREVFQNDTDEGFVIKFKSGFRVKIKFEEYVRLHRILTQISSRHIWEVLKDGSELDLDKIPDEVYDWVKETKSNILNQYETIEKSYKWIYDKLILYFKVHKISFNRKQFADLALRYNHPGILFNMLDGKDYSQIIWKFIKPKHEVPFKNLETLK